MLSDMTRTKFLARVISLSVIATLFFAVVQPALADDDEGDSEYKDPTIVTDDSTSVPEGVKDLGKKPEKKPIVNPVYQEWWFWATAIGVAGAVVALSVIPLQKKAPGCSPSASPPYSLGCVGDGR